MWAISATARSKASWLAADGLGRATDLAHELQRGVVHLVRGGGRLEVVQRADVAAHGVEPTCRRRVVTPSAPTALHGRSGHGRLAVTLASGFPGCDDGGRMTDASARPRARRGAVRRHRLHRPADRRVPRPPRPRRPPLGARRPQRGQARGRPRAPRRRSTRRSATCRCSAPTSTDDASLKDVANRARVVITTVGPYLTYGEPLVAACAEAGTDYVDLTGEPEFVDRMYVAHHATAEQHRRPAGPCLRLRLRSRTTSVPTSPSSAARRRADHAPRAWSGRRHAVSGGTFHSAMTQLSRASRCEQAHAARRQIEPRPEGRVLAGRLRQAAPRRACSAAGSSRCRPSTR